MSKLISIVLYGLAKSYISSKPLGMQTLYDNVSKLFINCCFILDFVSILNIIWANFFDPINEYVATILAFASYLCTVIVWQYGLWSFQMGDTKLDRYLPTNQNIKKNYLNLSFGLMASCQKVPNFDFQSQFSMSKVIRIVLIFFHWRIPI